MEPAMEWLLAHTDEPIPKDTNTDDKPSDTASSSTEKEAGEPAPVAKSLKCDDCGRLFKTSDEVEFHAAKSGHSNFSESTEEKKPLTEEEKKAQLAKLEEIMRQKRLEREEREKQEKLEREKMRIKSGKDLLEIKRKMEEQEMQKIVEERKREKEEEKRVRERVKAQIAADRLARKEKEAGLVAGSLSQTAAAPQPPAPTTPAQPKTYDKARIQLRLLDGSTLTESFDAKEQLAAIRLFIQMKQGVDIPFKLMTSFPKKIFTEDDYEQSLSALGLVPSAVLIVTKPT